ncbi:hypothetical protein [Mesorhizobium sp. Root172]|uniref:hypothetical protein n=1 Tax=Mesorhizobium sp. Root172 TaxID=1736481 RepID=UPI0006F6EBC7|nr:hypothetical protein [Mesorhizobium sp. Root172]KRB26299.1 hypothetical protein ASE05_10345 [Mesorhizobium sp. Root172]
MTDLERFRDTVEKFIAANGISPTRFGKEFAGDPLFVFELRKGREPRSDTRARVLAGITAERAA